MDIQESDLAAWSQTKQGLVFLQDAVPGRFAEHVCRRCVRHQAGSSHCAAPRGGQAALPSSRVRTPHRLQAAALRVHTRARSKRHDELNEMKCAHSMRCWLLLEQEQKQLVSSIRVSRWIVYVCPCEVFLEQVEESFVRCIWFDGSDSPFFLRDTAAETHLVCASCS